MVVEILLNTESHWGAQSKTEETVQVYTVKYDGEESGLLITAIYHSSVVLRLLCMWCGIEQRSYCGDIYGIQTF